MAKPDGSTRIMRPLRVRLTLSYVAFFAVLLLIVGLVFREMLTATLDRQDHEILEQEWAAIRGYLRIERGRPIWFFDRDDPEEAYIVERLRRVYVLADSQGRVLEVSPAYRSLGEPPQDIQSIQRAQKPAWRRRVNAEGVPYLIRWGTLYDDRHREYFVAIGRSLADNESVIQQFTRKYFSVVPAMLLSASLLGWLLAKRALRPVHEVARAAQRISGSNLSLRITPRGAGDELDHLIESFNRMIERLEASFQQIRQFSTDVSHELRTPLTAIRGQLEVALFTAQTAEQYRDALVNALQDVERLSQIVRALLLLSQAESGQLALQRSSVDLCSLVRDALEHFQIPAEEAGLRLHAELPAECRAEVDRIQSERLVSNLLSNAVKYTPAGGEVRVSLARSAEWIRLEVQDTGRGIPAEHLPHIFERFYRVPSPGGAPLDGLGLGLSFVNWIVKAHGGSIQVRSELGKGSCFTVLLPVSAGAATTGEAAGLVEPLRRVAAGLE